MNLKTIHQTISIQATKEKVWQVLFEESYTRLWYAAFSEGTKALTDWKEGSNVLFIDDKGFGLAGTVMTNKPGEMLSIEYYGEVVNGLAELDSEAARAVKGGRETYVLVEEQGNTVLRIAADMGADYFDFMSEAWQRALQKIKELAEEKK